jgi:hypothetical protein
VSCASGVCHLISMKDFNALYLMDKCLCIRTEWVILVLNEPDKCALSLTHVNFSMSESLLTTRN